MSHRHRKPVEIDLTDPSSSPPEAAPSEATPPEPSAQVPAPPTPEECIATLETQKAELRDRMLRIAADFDNWKKRSRKDLADSELRAKASVLRDFLEIADNLERATAHLGEGKESDAKSIRDGVDLVLRQFRSKLERYEVKAIETADQPFDPRFHEAISQTPTADAKPGSVLHELQRGYLIGDKLLRPAMVVVAVAPPPPAEEPEPSKATAGEAAPARTEGED
jgi:molecular chaperone GrpE